MRLQPGCLSGMRDDGESSLTPHGVKVLGNFRHVELSFVVEDHHSRGAEASDDVFPNKASNLCCDNGGDDPASIYLVK